MQKGQDGVVLISFGTIIATKYTPSPFIENILMAIKNLPQLHFIMKLDKDDEVGEHLEIKKIFYSKVHRKMAENIKNLYVTDWFSQPGILSKYF
jgi:hypothetical protein